MGAITLEAGFFVCSTLTAGSFISYLMIEPGPFRLVIGSVMMAAMLASLILRIIADWQETA